MKEINTLVLSLEYALTNQSLDIPTATLSILQDLKKQGLVLGLTSAKPVSFLQRYLRIKRLDNLFSIFDWIKWGRVLQHENSSEIRGSKFNDE